MWDVAVKYAADWNSVKFSAAGGFTSLTDEGCNSAGSTAGSRAGCTNVSVVGGGGGGGGVRHARQAVGLTLLRCFETTGPVFEPAPEFG
jgi:hypothetical protein